MMSRHDFCTKQLLLSLRKLSTRSPVQNSHAIARPFSSAAVTYDEAGPGPGPGPGPVAEAGAESEAGAGPGAAAIPRPSFRRNPDPELVSSRRLERRMAKANNPPIGSRRRRVALQGSDRIPFEQLPYQCFQEARKVLLADRQSKLDKIEQCRGQIVRLRQADGFAPRREAQRQQKLNDKIRRLDRLKVLADIHDPLVKRRFEDGLGDINKPIYRYLADKKWREYRRLVLMQRITQMNVTPDVLAKIEPTVDVKLAFIPPGTDSSPSLKDSDGYNEMRTGGFKYIQPGEFVSSIWSENPCWLNVQSFERGERLVSIAVIDSDVPDLPNDRFTYRCHFLASNIAITPTQRAINLSSVSKSNQLLLPWIPPHAQKGSRYHRLSVFVLQQKDNVPIDIEKEREQLQPEGFILRSFRDRHCLQPIGAHLFRTKWDEGMAQVMERSGIEGVDIELKGVKVEPLPYKRRNPSSFR